VTVFGAAQVQREPLEFHRDQLKDGGKGVSVRELVHVVKHGPRRKKSADPTESEIDPSEWGAHVEASIHESITMMGQLALSDITNQFMIAEADGIEALSMKLRTGDNRLKTLAAKVLVFTCMKNPQNQRMAISTLEPLIHMICRDSLQCKIEAADAIACICSGCPKAQMEAVRLGAAGALLDLKESGLSEQLRDRCQAALIAIKFLNLDIIIAKQMKNSTAPPGHNPWQSGEGAVSSPEASAGPQRPSTAINTGYRRSPQEHQKRGWEIYRNHRCYPSPPNVPQLPRGYCSPKHELSRPVSRIRVDTTSVEQAAWDTHTSRLAKVPDRKDLIAVPVPVQQAVGEALNQAKEVHPYRCSAPLRHPPP